MNILQSHTSKRLQSHPFKSTIPNLRIIYLHLLAHQAYDHMDECLPDLWLLDIAMCRVGWWGWMETKSPTKFLKVDMSNGKKTPNNHMTSRRRKKWVKKMNRLSFKEREEDQTNEGISRWEAREHKGVVTEERSEKRGGFL